MKFNHWLDANLADLEDYIFEGDRLKTDIVTWIEGYARKAYVAGWEQGFDSGCDVGERL